MQSIVVTKSNSRRNSRSILVAAVLALGTLAGCSGNLPPATVPSSGVTSSNGGGMRATGAIPDVGVSNGNATVTTMQRNPVQPRY